jgi:hypothetical protein
LCWFRYISDRFKQNRCYWSSRSISRTRRHHPRFRIYSVSCPSGNSHWKDGQEAEVIWLLSWLWPCLQDLLLLGNLCLDVLSLEEAVWPLWFNDLRGELQVASPGQQSQNGGGGNGEDWLTEGAVSPPGEGEAGASVKKGRDRALSGPISRLWLPNPSRVFRQWKRNKKFKVSFISWTRSEGWLR